MSPPRTPRASITGVILAGGRSRRMGGIDKGLLELAGRPMVEYLIDALRPQVGEVLINANRNHDRYAGYGLRVVPDMVGEYFGPLAGMASAMQAARTVYVLTVPCDSPFAPPDLAVRLHADLTRADAELAVAGDATRMQPVFALLKVALLPSILEFLASGERKIDRWYAGHRHVVTDFSDRPETFLNINSPEDHASLEAMLGSATQPRLHAQ